MESQAGSNTTSTVACNAGGSYNGTVTTFSPGFDSPPAVLHTVSSNSDTSRVFSHVNGNDGTRQSEPTTTQMSTVLHRGFDSCTHSAETIDWIAIEPTHTAMLGGFTLDATRSDDSIACCTATGYPVSYFDSFASAPGVALTSQLGEDGGNGGYSMIHEGTTVTNTSLAVTIDEDGPGADRGHTNEIVSLVSFDQPSGLFFESNTITYSISGGADSGHIMIEAVTGTLSFITAPDPLAPSDTNGDGIYEVVIAACDSHCASKCDTQTLYIDVSDGEVCIDGPSGFTFSGSFTTESSAQTIEQVSDEYFTVEDMASRFSGWYTTLAITSLSGATYGDLISNEASIEWYATGVDLVTGDVNTGVVLASGRTGYRTASGTVTFIKRDPGENSDRKGTYGVKPWIRLTIPPYLRADMYQGSVCYTLYEN